MTGITAKTSKLEQANTIKTWDALPAPLKSAIADRLGGRDLYALAATSKSWMAAVIASDHRILPQQRDALTRLESLNSSRRAPAQQAKLWRERIEASSWYKKLVWHNDNTDFWIDFMMYSLMCSVLLTSVFAFMMEEGGNAIKKTAKIGLGVVLGFNCALVSVAALQFVVDGVLKIAEKIRRKKLELAIHNQERTKKNQETHSTVAHKEAKVVREVARHREIRQKVCDAIRACDCEQLKALAPALSQSHRCGDTSGAAATSSEQEQAGHASLFRLILEQNVAGLPRQESVKSQLIGILLDAGCELDVEEFSALTTMDDSVFRSHHSKIKNLPALAACLPADALQTLFRRRRSTALAAILKALAPHIAAAWTNRIDQETGVSPLYTAAAESDAEMLKILIAAGGNVDLPSTHSGISVRDVATHVGSYALGLETSNRLAALPTPNLRRLLRHY